MEFEPVEYYHKQLKDKIRQASEDYFENLIKKANIDVELNEKTFKEYTELDKKDKAGESKIRRLKVYRVLLIMVPIIIFFIFIIGLATTLMNMYDNKTFTIVSGILLGVSLVGVILFLCLYLNKRIKALLIQDAINNEQLQELLNKLFAQLKPLKDLLHWKDFNNIVNKTTDMFKLDDQLDSIKLNQMQKMFESNEELTQSQSILAVSSGNIATNPFIRFKMRSQEMQNHVYTGHLTIHWTTHSRDSNGHMVTHHHSQTLTATITKPAPVYIDGIYTLYGNNAADKLCFTHYPTHVNFQTSEKELQKIEKEESKKMEKMTKQAIENNGTFQNLANTKFESLFQAYDRNNELEYRLLFTPLAQQNMVELITSEPYGDDFYFRKNKKFNLLTSSHSNNYYDYNKNVFNNYISVEYMKKDFVNLICNLFESLYFDLAPILCIPLYQQTEAGKFTPDDDLPFVSGYEAEALSNQFDPEIFKPENCETRLILKTKFYKKLQKSDIYEVNSYGFSAIPHTDYVPVPGGDGFVHDVPVTWFEYIPVSKQSFITTSMNSTNKLDYDKVNKYFSAKGTYKNLIAFSCLNDYNDYSQEDEDIISSIFKDYIQ